MLQVTNKGIVIDRLDEIHKRLSDGFKTIYGEDINIDSDTPDGQIIGLLSQSLADINEVIAFMFQMLDPYRATGEWLEQRALYAGLVRRGAEYSYINDAIAVGQPRKTIPKGTVFYDENDNKWLSLAEVTLNDLGSAKLSLRSDELGVFSLPVGAELKMLTVILGIDKVTLATATIPGKEEEMDGEFLTRFMRSHAVNNNDDKEGIKAALLSLPDVKKVEVIENDSNEFDSRTNVPAHTMNAIVLGGSDSDIATMLLKKKIGGGAFMGNQKLSLYHKDANRIVRFDRPEEVRVSVDLVIRRLAGFTDIDTDSIKSALENTDFAIGESVYVMRLVNHVNSVDGFVIEQMTVNGDSHVDIGLRQYAKIYADDVEVLIE